MNEESAMNPKLRLKGNLFDVDFLNPTPAILEDAKAQGLDLSDGRYVETVFMLYVFYLYLLEDYVYVRV